MNNDNPLISDLNANNTVNILEAVPVSLPSRGFWYNASDVFTSEDKANSIPVYGISMYEENLMSNPMLFISGNAITAFLERAVPDVIRHDLITDMDMHIIFLASRIASHGAIYNTSIGCVHCDNVDVVEVNLQNHLNNFTVISDDDKKKYDYYIKGIDQTIHLRPLSYFNTIDIIKNIVNENDNDNDIDINDIDNKEKMVNLADIIKTKCNNNMEIFTNLVMGVTTSQGNRYDDPKILKDWIKRIDSKIINHVIDYVAGLHNEFMQRSDIEFECSSCKKINEHRMEIDPIKFFMSAGDTATTISFAKKTKNMETKEKKPSKRLQK